MSMTCFKVHTSKQFVQTKSIQLQWWRSLRSLLIRNRKENDLVLVYICPTGNMMINNDFFQFDKIINDIFHYTSSSM